MIANNLNVPLDILSLDDRLALIGIVALAYFVRGISGFGSGLIAIPLLALYLPLQVAVPAVALLDNLAATKQGLQHRDSIVWKDLLPLIPLMLLSVIAGLYLLQTLNPEILQKSMGGFLLLYAGYRLSGTLPHRKYTLATALPFGIAGGLISTMLGTGGPFYVIYLQLRDMGKLQFRATIAVIFLFDGIMRVASYLISGLMDTTILLAVAAALPIMWISMRVGGHLHNKLSPQGVERFIALLIISSGTTLLLR